MTLKRTSIADLEMRRRWNLADDDPGPTSLPKMLFREDEARRLDEARSHPSEFRPERDGKGGVVAYGAEIGGQEGTDVLAGGAGDDTLKPEQRDARGSRRGPEPIDRKVDKKWVLADGRYGLNPHYDPSFDITLGQAIGIPPLIGAAAALAPTATAALALIRSGRAAQSAGADAKIAKYIKQGFNQIQAERLASPYTGRGHHYVPRNRAVTLIKGLPPLKGLPPKISESRFNVLKPKGITRGDFYELHYKVDPSFSGARLPGRGPGWSGGRLGLKEYDRMGRLWHGSPMPLKAVAGGAMGIAGAGGAFGYFADGD
jgi:hypothetical protein